MRRGGPGIPVPESAHQGPDSAAGGVPGSACLAGLMACRRQSGILHQAGWEGEGDQWKSSPASKAAPGQAYEPGYRFGRGIGRARAVRTATQKGGKWAASISLSGGRGLAILPRLNRRTFGPGYHHEQRARGPPNHQEEDNYRNGSQEKANHYHGPDAIS